MFTARTRTLVDLLTTGLVITTCIFLVRANWFKFFSPAPPIPKAPVSIDGAMLKGDSRASVVMIEWSDYECPYCGKAEGDVLPKVETRYISTHQVQLAFFHHPLVKLHPHAEKAAEAATCASRQGMFWQMHSALFRDQAHLEEPDLIARARKLGLDEAVFGRCLAGEATTRVQEDASRASGIGLSGTPAFIIGRRRPDGRVEALSAMTGVGSEGAFVDALDRALGQRRSDSSAVWLVASVGATLAVAAFVAIGTRRARMRLRRSSFS